MNKWLTIMGIVCIGFIVVLLGLGYLLKENEAKSTALKNKLDQEKLMNASKKQPSKAVLTFVDSKESARQLLNEQKRIIAKNLTCISSQQCTVVNTYLSALGCVVPINSIGASLLEKVIYKPSLSMSDTSSKSKSCEQVVQTSSICIDNLCQLDE